jgi:DNA-binding transcriptional LysR family regulator
VQQAGALEATLDGLSAADVQDIRIGLPPDLPAAVVGALLRAGAEAGAGTDVEVVQGTPVELEQAVRAGDVATAVLRHPLPADVVVDDAFERPTGVLLRHDSPLAGRPEVEPAELDGHDLVAPPRTAGPAQHDALVTALGALGWAPRTVRFADGPDATAGVVLAGGAVAVTTGSHAVPDGLTWRPLAGGAVPVRVSVARRRGATPGELALARTLEALLEETDGWTRVPRHTAGPPRPRPSSGLPW